MQKQFVEAPLPMDVGVFGKVAVALQGLLLTPWYLALAWLRGAPGIGLHLRIVATGLRLLLRGRGGLRNCARYAAFPMDSTRYFEFEAVWNSATASRFTRYLDVS